MASPVWLYKSELVCGAMVNADRVAFVEPLQMGFCRVWFSGMDGDSILVERPFEQVVSELWGDDALLEHPGSEIDS